MNRGLVEEGTRMKRVVLIMSALVAVLLIGSCAGGAEEQEERRAGENRTGAPDWFLNPPVADDAIYGVGSAKMASLDRSRRMAVARAREDIAFQTNASIEAAIIDYAQEAGVDDNNQVVSFVENISRQITDTTLRGSRTDRIEQGPDGMLYALVSYPKNGFIDAAGEAFQRNEDAAFAEFKAQQALEFLDSQVENNPTRAGSSGQ
jgi:uncharacterized membrane protein